MPDDEKAVELQKKWNENRYEIIDLLDDAVIKELRKKSPDPDKIGKLSPARLMFFQEFLSLADRSTYEDLKSAYSMINTNQKGGTA